MCVGVRFVCVPSGRARSREDSMVEWDRTDQHFLVLYSFLERGNQAKTLHLNSAPKSELTLDWHRSTVARGCERERGDDVMLTS